MKAMAALLGLAVPAGALALAPGVVQATPVPPAVAAMIDAAAATGDIATLKTVADLAKKTNPDCVAEIDALVATLKTEAQKARAEKLASQSLWRAITGEGQIGGNMSTGSSNTANLTLGLKLSAETLRWKQTLAFTADYEKENGVLSQEDYSAGYEVRYKFTSRTYALGTLVWDRDPFDGYSDRGAASIGLGYKLIDRPNISFSLDIGPAVRSVAYVATPDEPAFDRTEAAARAGAAFSWTIIPKTVLTETLATYVQSADKNFNSTTAITTKLAGALSARLSFQVQYDSLLPPGYDSIDTTTRLTMVYGF